MLMQEAAATARARRNGIGDMLHRSAARYPQSIAIEDGATAIGYRDLERLSGVLAARLWEAGARKGERVAIFSHNCWQFVLLWLATARIGAVLVPVNFMLGADEIGYILGHSGARLLFAEDRLARVADEALSAGGHGVERRIAIPLGGALPDGWEDIAAWIAGDAVPPDVEVADDDPVRLMYTSGTESRPKGALLSARALMAQYLSCIDVGEMRRDDVEVHALPFYHCAQFDCFLNPDLMLGARSIILRGADPETLLRTIAERRVTKLFCPPTVWIGLLRSPRFDACDLSSLTKGYVGASAMPVETIRELARRLPGLRLWNFYGQTELSPLACALLPDEQESRPGSAGRPVMFVETRVVDDDDRELPRGETGEIVHRSPQAMIAYYRDPERTAEAFRNGWFHSGDLGFMDADGYVSVVDRKKDMIKTGGENVSSREVEEVLYMHAAVAEVAVVGIPDPEWVEAVLAVIVPRAGIAVSPEELVRHARGHLAGYKTPKLVVLAESLPKNPSGKILKRELRDLYRDLRMATA